MYICVCAYDHTCKTAQVTPPHLNVRMELRNPWCVLQILPHLVLSCSSNIIFSPWHLQLNQTPGSSLLMWRLRHVHFSPTDTYDVLHVVLWLPRWRQKPLNLRTHSSWSVCSCPCVWWTDSHLWSLSQNVPASERILWACQDKTIPLFLYHEHSTEQGTLPQFRQHCLFQNRP